MLLLLEICAVVVSLAVVAIAVAAVRATSCLDRATNEISKVTVDLQLLIGQANELTREMRETAVSVHGVIAPIRRVVDRFETLGERTASLSAAVLEGIEPPVHTAIALARGVRSVTSFFLGRFSHRNAHGRVATNGDSGNE